MKPSDYIKETVDSLKSENRSPLVKIIFDSLLGFFVLVIFTQTALLGIMTSKIYDLSKDRAPKVDSLAVTGDSLSRVGRLIILNQEEIKLRLIRMEYKIDSSYIIKDIKLGK